MHSTACRREVDEREKDPNFVSDAYAECYPAYHEYNNTIVDSDDEADFSHMDSKTGGKSRTDFDTEEQWQARSSHYDCVPLQVPLQVQVQMLCLSPTDRGVVHLRRFPALPQQGFRPVRMVNLNQEV